MLVDYTFVRSPVPEYRPAARRRQKSARGVLPPTHTRVHPRAERDTWVSMWSLDKDDGKGAEEAVRRAHELVLKPQREGGGNNVYRGNIPPLVAQMPKQERVAWVAMELIRPPRAVGAYLVRSGTGRVSARVMNEFGVFGWALFGEGREIREEQVGWLVRTKAEDVDEGGVAAGFSVLDSVVLVD